MCNMLYYKYSYLKNRLIQFIMKGLEAYEKMDKENNKYRYLY